MDAPIIKILKSAEDMNAVEELQRIVWPGSETDVVPAHMLITAIHNGGLVAGAYANDQLIGFVFGFPGIEFIPDGPRLKHCSHMMGIDPKHRELRHRFCVEARTMADGTSSGAGSHHVDV